MTFQDIFKSDFLENTVTFSLFDTMLALFLAFAIGLFIFTVYKKTFRGINYSSGFGASLIAMTLITTFVILAVTSNVVLSLGMVGALSIVRFRAAIKEPLDIAFLFWAIASGIVLGAGMLPLALFGSVLIGIVMVIFVNKKPFDHPYVLIVNCNHDTAEKAVQEQMKHSLKKFAIKSKTVRNGGIEFTADVRLKKEEMDFVNTIAAISGVTDAVLVSYHGEYMA